ncbi:PREDICTED: odorant receptor 4-like [Ceratosolen solmsi marchali]|uniref:Odorant receptor 4-like n=1 Tax=Ceratosolen solmsi marchali TaxID=326594 RepID=A0AAJ6YLT2_9HYME|nr:PREDICTED: odorant receptor 4-like [Ceratosolen solmsi marchali]
MGDLNAVIDNLLSNLPIAMVVLKMFEFRRHRKELVITLSLVIDAWNARKTKIETRNMREDAAVTRKILLICMTLGFLSIEGLLLMTIGQDIDIHAGHADRKFPMISSYFWYDINSSPVYEITWLLQYIATVLTTIAHTGVTGIFIGLVLHLRCQISNLRLRLEKLDIYDRNKMIRKKIEFIVMKHENINKFAKGIENIFNFMFLVEVFSCTVLLCMQFYVLVTLTTNDSKKYPIISTLLLYLLNVGAHLFVCCYTTDKLRDEGLSISQSAYNYEWYNLSVSDAKLLIIVMQRAGKPLQISAGKLFPISMRLYSQIIITSVRYLSILIALRDKI